MFCRFPCHVLQAGFLVHLSITVFPDTATLQLFVAALTREKLTQNWGEINVIHNLFTDILLRHAIPANVVYIESGYELGMDHLLGHVSRGWAVGH